MNNIKIAVIAVILCFCSKVLAVETSTFVAKIEQAYAYGGADLKNATVSFVNHDTVLYSDSNGIVEWKREIPVHNIVGINQITSPSIEYTGNSLKINIIVNSQVQISIFTLRGQLISQNSGKYSQGIYFVPLPSLARGAYLLKADIGNKKICSKFISGIASDFHPLNKVRLSLRENRDNSEIIDTVIFSYPGYSDIKKPISSYNIYLKIAMGGLDGDLYDVKYDSNKPGDDYAYSVINTSDSGYLVAGTTESHYYSSSSPGKYTYLIKLDKKGNKQWEHKYSIRKTMTTSSIIKANDTGYLIPGACRTGYTDKWNWFLIKINNSGDTLWSKTYDVPEQASEVKDIVSTGNGYIMTGQNFHTIKINEMGEIVWKADLNIPDYSKACAITESHDSTYIIAGNLQESITEPGDLLLVKIDKYGEKIWSKTYGGQADDYASSITSSPAGGYIVTGATKSYGEGQYDFYILNIDENGDTIYTATYGEIDFGISRDEQINSVVLARDGGFILVGTKEYPGRDKDIIITKIDNQGTTVWVKHFLTDQLDVATDICPGSDNGYIVTGYTIRPSHSDVYVMKIDEEGNLLSNW